MLPQNILVTGLLQALRLKEALIAACAAQSFSTQSVTNQRTPLLAWLKSLSTGSRIGLESTDCYHELLADLAHAQGHVVFLLNPLDTKHYARAIGSRAKTDRVDADSSLKNIRPYTPPNSRLAQAGSHDPRRCANIVCIKSSLTLTMSNLSGFAAELKAVSNKLDALIAKIDSTMTAIAAHSPQHKEAQQRLQTIAGVGPVVGMALTNTLERVPFRNADAFVAFTGFDPGANDSGNKIGRRRLSKSGPAELRRLLFDAAMAAAKSKAWKSIYEHYRAHGWTTPGTGNHRPQNRPLSLVYSSLPFNFRPGKDYQNA